MTAPPGSLTRHSSRRKRGLHGEVVDKLGQMIVTGDPITDGPLVMDELLQRFDVSRTVLREALRSLESKRLITARPQVGTIVRPMNEWNLLDPDIVEWRALNPEQGDQRGDLLGLRQVIVTFAARLAAGTRAPDMLEALIVDVDDMEEAVGYGQADLFAQADASFHYHLVDASESLLLTHLYSIITQGLTACGEPTGCDRTDVSVKSHWEVIDALCQGSDEAERSVRNLLADPVGVHEEL